MKKILKSKIFIVIITTIIVASGTLYASNIYKSEEILYNTSDGKSMSVSEALNDLYTNRNNSGYKVYEFSRKLATVGGTPRTYKDNGFVDLSVEKITKTDCTVSDSADGLVYFSIDLDFIPKKIVAANICLTVGGSTSTEPYNIRIKRGYQASSTTNLYYYTNKLCTQYKSDSLWGYGLSELEISLNNKDNYNEPRCSNYYYIKENKLYFASYAYRTMKGDGTCTTGNVNSFYQVRGTSFYLSGTIVYEE